MTAWMSARIILHLFIEVFLFPLKLSFFKVKQRLSSVCYVSDCELFCDVLHQGAVYYFKVKQQLSIVCYITNRDCELFCAREPSTTSRSPWP